MAAAGIRTARAALFTALCLTLSVGAHVLLSGAPVPLTTLAAVGAVVFLPAFALASRECGYWRIAALLIPLELFADTVFTTGQQACYGQSGGPVTGPLRSMGIDFLCTGGEVGTPLAQMASGHASLHVTAHVTAQQGSPWLLLAAHLAVGLAAAAWLRRGEAAAARLLRATAATAFRPLLLAVAACRPVVGPGLIAARALPVRVARVPLLLLHSVPRRGPPCAPATA